MNFKISNLITIFISTIFTLFFIEIFLMIFFNLNVDSSIQTAYEFDKNKGWNTKKNFKIFRSSNSFAHFTYYDENGFLVSKDKFQSSNNDKAKKNIILIGDSFVEGYYVKSSDSFSVLLDSNHEKIYFINGGVSGYSPEQYVLKFKSIYKNFNENNLHTLIFFLPYNDIEYFGKKHYEGFSKPYYDPMTDLLVSDILENQNWNIYESFKLKHLITKTQIYALLRPTIKKLFFVTENIFYQNKDYYEYDEEDYQKILKFFSNNIPIENDKYSIFYIPVLKEFEYGLYENNLKKFFTKCNELNIICSNILPIKSDFENMYLENDGHFNSYGSCVAFNQISSFLQKKGYTNIKKKLLSC